MCMFQFFSFGFLLVVDALPVLVELVSESVLLVLPMLPLVQQQVLPISLRFLTSTKYINNH